MNKIQAKVIFKKKNIRSETNHIREYMDLVHHPSLSPRSNPNPSLPARDSIT